MRPLIASRHIITLDADDIIALLQEADVVIHPEAHVVFEVDAVRIEWTSAS